MNANCFQLEIVTPSYIATHEVRSLRLMDGTGFFGIMRGHCDFLTVLLPALGYFIDAGGNEHFLAVDGGIFNMHSGVATLTAGEAFEDDDAGRLSQTIAATLNRRDSAEQAISLMIEGIQNSFLEKMSAMSRRGGV
jgi:F-type H+-transporting ATPase subunit epsilon